MRDEVVALSKQLGITEQSQFDGIVGRSSTSAMNGEDTSAAILSLTSLQRLSQSHRPVHPTILFAFAVKSTSAPSSAPIAAALPSSTSAPPLRRSPSPLRPTPK